MDIWFCLTWVNTQEENSELKGMLCGSVFLFCAMSTMDFGRAAKFTLKGINSLALVQMLPPNETNRHPNVCFCLLTFEGVGQAAV